MLFCAFDDRGMKSKVTDIVASKGSKEKVLIFISGARVKYCTNILIRLKEKSFKVLLRLIKQSQSCIFAGYGN